MFELWSDPFNDQLLVGDFSEFVAKYYQPFSLQNQLL